MPPLNRKRTRHFGRCSPTLPKRSALLGKEQRLLILCHRVQAGLGVGELLSRLNLSQSAFTQHLAMLREA